MNLIDGLKMYGESNKLYLKMKIDSLEARIVVLEGIIKKTIYHVIKPGESNENTKSTNS